MKTVSELAYDAIVIAEILPTENIGIDSVIDRDWNGETRIVITEGDAEIEGTQFGAVGQTSVLTVYALSADRKTAIETCRDAGRAAYKAIEKLERKQGYGILAITVLENGVKNVEERNEFEAFRSYNVINKINL
jgi:hypothetical protein